MSFIFRYVYFYVVLFLISPLFAMSDDKFLNEMPVLIEADRFEFIGDKNNNKTIAIGNVIAIQGNQKVMADFVEYNKKTDVLLARDKVRILQKEGYIIDADKVILSDRLKFGSMNNFTIIMPDKSTLKAEFAKKEQEFIIDVDKGFYTSCKICEGKPPIWDIQSKSSTLDEEENSLTYHHAVFRYYGIPTLYTPYLSHYTSKAKRKSGFLKPSYRMSTYLGAAVKIPYYFNLAPNYDATMKVIVTEKRGNVLESDYRHLFHNGSMRSAGSITSAKYYTQPEGTAPLDPDIRYHLNSESDFALKNNNYIGWRAKVTSDKSYLRDYGYGSEDYLTSRVYNSAYQKSGFYEIQTLSFQNLRPESGTNKNKMYQTPIVLPLFESKHNIFYFSDGSRLSFESNLLKIHRYAGADTNRFSIKNKWQKNFLTDNGQKFNFFGSVRNDFYRYENAPIHSGDYTGNVYRTIPEAGIGWSYPLENKIDSTKVVLEPIVSAIATPYTKYNKDIYNEDSPSSELNDGNLFAESRYSGIDLVENTGRVSYGIKTSAYYKNQIDGSLLIGQMYRENSYDYINGVKEDRFSDYVGRLKLNISNKMILSYQFKLDKYTLINKTNEATVKLNQDKAYIQSDVLYYRDGKTVDGVKNRREINLETGINDYNNISFSINGKKSLTNSKDNPDLYVDPNGFISAGAKIKYVNDCITYAASINRDFTQNQDRKEDTTIWFDISLKNISE
ncbi:MAG: LPS assembly protein LptD [Rickettsiales bacterium]|nr:LPS assembly protein LptD [Rickettsiales bacterium]